MPRPVKIAAVTRIFKTGYKRKSTQDRDKVKAALDRMELDLAHQSLRVQKMSGTPDLYEARASDSIRITFKFVEGDQSQILLRKCCTHDQAYRRP